MNRSPLLEEYEPVSLFCQRCKAQIMISPKEARSMSLHIERGAASALMFLQDQDGIVVIGMDGYRVPPKGKT